MKNTFKRIVITIMVALAMTGSVVAQEMTVLDSIPAMTKDEIDICAADPEMEILADEEHPIVPDEEYLDIYELKEELRREIFREQKRDHEELKEQVTKEVLTTLLWLSSGIIWIKNICLLFKMNKKEKSSDKVSD